MHPQLSKYRAVITLDTEYRTTPYGHVVPVCMCATDIVSGQRWQIWEDGQMEENPLPVGSDVLYVSYAAPAEWSYFLAQGRDLPENILDLYILHKLQANGWREFRDGKMRDMKCNLLQMMAENGLAESAYTPEQKKIWRNVINDHAEYTPAQRQGILDYCSADERDLQLLLPKLLPQFDLEVLLRLGDFTRVLGWMEFNGIPVDVSLCRRLQKHWTEILVGIAQRSGLPVFRYDEKGVHLDEGLYAAYIDSLGFGEEFPRSKKTKKFSKSVSKKAKDQPNLFSMARKHPELQPLYETLELLQNYKNFTPPIGPDGRWRAPNVPWEQKTGRVTPKGANLFRMHSWFRFLIQPPPGRALAYIDLISAEYGIGGILSGDESMIGTYTDVIEGRAESPYLVTGKKLGILPPAATKKHPKYKPCKSTELGQMYGQTPQGCAAANNIDIDLATEFQHGHRQLYHKYWSYTSWRIREARGSGIIRTPLGYSMNVNRTVENNTLLNWSCQATCAEIMRLATSRMVDEGLSICITVHDAVLIEADEAEIAAHTEIAKECWRWASEKVLGFRMESDCKIIRSGERYEDDDGQEQWNKIMKLLIQAEAEAEQSLTGLHDLSERNGLRESDVYR